MKIGEEIDLVGAVSGTGQSSYNLDADYYKQKFLDLVKWLEAREDLHDKQACLHLDNCDSNAIKDLSALQATKCARMWIRNHVLLPEV